MSTRSELHHCSGLGTVVLVRADFVGGTTVFYCRHEKKAGPFANARMGQRPLPQEPFAGA